MSNKRGPRESYSKGKGVEENENTTLKAFVFVTTGMVTKGVCVTFSFMLCTSGP